MTDLSEHEILWNSAALGSLRRPQLMSLSKKYGLKANGKNAEMAARLHEFGTSLTPSSKAVFDQASAAAVDPDSPTKRNADAPEDNQLAPAQEEEEDDIVSAQLAIPSRPMRSMPSSRTLGRGSDAWEVLTQGNASLEEITEQHYEEDTPDTAPRAWKSANNGEKLAGEFRGNTELRGVGSLRSLASSIRRTASRTLSGRQHKDGRSPTPSVTFPGVSAEEDQPVERETEELEDDLPGSPASAIGVAKRHSTMSLHHKPSTIRMVSPSPTLGMNFERAMSPELDDDDELPLTGQNTVEQIKQRRSMAPVRAKGFPPSALRVRNSAPTLLSPATSKKNISNIYPELPNFDTLAAPGAPPRQSPTKRSSPTKARSPSPAQDIPGAFPSATSPSFVFGNAAGNAPAPQFSAAGLKLLEEMQAKMGTSGGTFNPELLKGKKAQMTKLVSVNEDLAKGPGGWGLSAGPSAQPDRYAEAHQRQFAKMRSLSSSTKSTEPRSRSTSVTRPSPPKRKHQSSAPAMEQAKEAAETDRNVKRTKVSTGPRYLESIRGALAGKLSEDKPPNLVSPRKKSSLKPESMRKFAFLRSKKAAATDTASIAESVRSEGSYILPSPSVPIDVQHRPSPPKKGSIPAPSRLKRSDTTSTMSAMAGGSLGSQGPKAPKQRHVSTSARSTLGTSQQRPPIPDFGPPLPKLEPLKDHSSGRSSRIPTGSHRSMSTSVASSSMTRSSKSHSLNRVASGDLKTASAASSLSSRGSRSDLLSPPSLSSRASRSDLTDNVPTPPGSMRRSSTLFAPTASSLARMHATVKPPAASTPTGSARRPLPRPPQSPGPGVLSPAAPSPAPARHAPQIPTVLAFGEAASRTNRLFESNFHMSQPVVESAKRPLPFTPGQASPSVASPAAVEKLKSPSRAVYSSPAKAGSISATRARDRTSGVAALKSKGHHDDKAVAQRRAEIKARQERLATERELRRMLG
ncbi:hypothetical protein Q8F55_007709 [Vanrija albida]|uniref:SAP domain-containing protein n=1 Tax=Vanrija albida TaxID=181172 RepID=A0ABR3PUA6_9TREE